MAEKRVLQDGRKNVSYKMAKGTGEKIAGKVQEKVGQVKKVLGK